MTVYKYRAKSFDGKIKKGMVAASGVEDFLARLKSQGLFCLSYTVEEKTSKKKEYNLSLKDLLFFCRQMSGMLSGGMTVMRSIEIVSKRTTGKKQQKIYLALYEDVQKGTSLSDAMALQGETFPKILINMISYGEMTGDIDGAISRMAENYEKEIKLKNSIKGAMMYPIILLVVSVLVVTVLLAFVMPIILKMFDEEQLPWSTRFLSKLSNLIVQYWYIFILGILTVIIALKAALKNERFRLSVDMCKLRLPVFGKLNRTVATGRFSRTLASLYASGVPLVESLQTAIKVVGNTYIEKCFKEVIVMVKQGSELSAALGVAGIFDNVFNSMLYVGEQSGNLEGILYKTAIYFDEQADSALKRMVTVIQPIMIVLLAVIIGFIIISIITPIYGVYSM